MTRRFASLDIEATGTSPEGDRAVEVAVVRLEADGTRTPRRWLVNPERPIPAEATAVHRITDEQVAGAPTFAEVAPEIAAALSGVDLVGYNLRSFDIPMLRAEFARARVAWAPGNVVDAYVIFHERERHTLGTAVRWYCGRELVAAHSAVADADATLDVVLAQLERYPDLGAMGPAELDVASGGRQPDWATERGHLRWRADGDLYVAWGKHSGLRLWDMDEGFLRWVLRNDFPADVHEFVRRVCRNERPRAPGAPPLPPARPASDDPDDETEFDIPF